MGRGLTMITGQPFTHSPENPAHPHPNAATALNSVAAPRKAIAPGAAFDAASPRAAQPANSANRRPDVPSPDEMQPAMSAGALIGMLLAVIIGAIGAAVVMPAILPRLTHSLLGSEPKAYWYLSRSSAFVSYGLMWISMVLGLLMTNKLARMWPGGPTSFDLHQYSSLLGLAFAMFHALILMGDAYIAYTFAQILTPFASVDYKPLWVGLGQIGFYVMVIVGFSFYARRVITQKGWRVVHFLSFALFVLALVHGLQSGTDATTPWALAVYWISGVSVLFLTVYRILAKVAPVAN